jgi:hypothetical protein
MMSQLLRLPGLIIFAPVISQASPSIMDDGEDDFDIDLNATQSTAVTAALAPTPSG